MPDYIVEALQLQVLYRDLSPAVLLDQSKLINADGSSLQHLLLAQSLLKVEAAQRSERYEDSVLLVTRGCNTLHLVPELG